MARTPGRPDLCHSLGQWPDELDIVLCGGQDRGLWYQSTLSESGFYPGEPAGWPRAKPFIFVKLADMTSINGENEVIIMAHA